MATYWILLADLWNHRDFFPPARDCKAFIFAASPRSIWGHFRTLVSWWFWGVTSGTPKFLKAFDCFFLKLRVKNTVTNGELIEFMVWGVWWFGFPFLDPRKWFRDCYGRGYPIPKPPISTTGKRTGKMTEAHLVKQRCPVYDLMTSTISWH